MKGTLADWRKMTLAGMVAQRDALNEQRDVLSVQIEDMTMIIMALEPLELASKVTRKTREGKETKAATAPKRKLSEAHKRALARGRAKWVKAQKARKIAKKEK